MKKIISCYAIIFLTILSSCSSDSDEDSSTAIPATAQKQGDAAAGWDYLRYGDLFGSGLPAAQFAPLLSLAFGSETTPNALQREGSSAALPTAFNRFSNPDGLELLGGLTCMACHAGYIDGQFIPGLGNTELDYSLGDISVDPASLTALIEAVYGAGSAEAQVTERYAKGALATAPYAEAPVRGLNMAFAIEEAAVAHRDPQTLAWLDEAQFNAAEFAYASDVPPLWLVKKKHALYYNGMGRGDFSRLILQVFTPTIPDRQSAERIVANGADVLAWINELEAPPYPAAIDRQLAAEGGLVFAQHCESCHGSYGQQPHYPNRLISIDEVGTDPWYALHFIEHDDLARWYNASWYAQNSSLQPSAAYIAPPLDGIWASAPYFHNGSVPNLLAVINSAERPASWKRSFDSSDYDWDRLGWHYQAGMATDRETYNTSLQGYSNAGHTYGDVLSAAQQLALLEYLKTL